MNDSLLGILTAILIGALIGLERERHKRTEGLSGSAGVRSFAIAALSGATAYWLEDHTGIPGLMIVTITLFGLTALMRYGFDAWRDPNASGLTTTLALILTVMLGATALESRELAGALGIATMALLAYKQPLHEAIHSLKEDDVYNAAKLLVASFIVLPLLPNQAIDPWGAINPYRLWWLAILLAALSFIGYLSARYWGRAHGYLITALSGALVSSTAVTLSMARQSRASSAAHDNHYLLAAATALAWGVMFARLPIVISLVSPATAIWLAWQMVPMALICLLAALIMRKKSEQKKGAPGPTMELKNPFSLWEASQFALLLGALLLGVRLGANYLSPENLVAIAALAGITDVDAAALSLTQESVRNARMQPYATAILAAAMANTLLKAGITWSVGLRTYHRPLIALMIALGAFAGFSALLLPG